jgi:hypothetical protein
MRVSKLSKFWEWYKRTEADLSGVTWLKNIILGLDIIKICQHYKYFKLWIWSFKCSVDRSCPTWMKTKFYCHHSILCSYIKYNKNAWDWNTFHIRWHKQTTGAFLQTQTAPGQVIFTSLWRTYLLKLVFLTILRISQNSHTDLNNDKMFPRLYVTLLQEVPVKYKCLKQTSNYAPPKYKSRALPLDQPRRCHF